MGSGIAFVWEVISEGQFAFAFNVAKTSLMFSVCNLFLSIFLGGGVTCVYCKITEFPFIDEIALLLAVN
jgi:hypothetical protein